MNSSKRSVTNGSASLQRASGDTSAGYCVTNTGVRQRRLDRLLEQLVLELARAGLRPRLDALLRAHAREHRAVADVLRLELGIRALQAPPRR